MEPSYVPGELNRLRVAADPPSADDVSVAVDGRRLESAEAVIAFFEEMGCAPQQIPAILLAKLALDVSVQGQGTADAENGAANATATATEDPTSISLDANSGTSGGSN